MKSCFTQFNNLEEDPRFEIFNPSDLFEVELAGKRWGEINSYEHSDAAR